MNKIFRVIWNRALERFDVVSELPQSDKKVKAESDFDLPVSNVNSASNSFKLSRIATTLTLLLGSVNDLTHQ